MQWQEIRNHYPNTWVLVEAINAHSEANKRIIEQLAVINTYSDSKSAFKSYQKLHRESPQREYYMFHTDLEKLEISERKWLGIRGA